MKRETDESHKKPFDRSPVLTVIVAIANILLLACAIMLYGRYARVYQERLHEENLGNIANLNQSAAANATALIGSWDIKLKDIARYADRHAMTRIQMLRYIEDCNSNAERQLQLIDDDYTGFLARKDPNGDFIPVSYASSSYAAMQNCLNDEKDVAFEDICFAPEFTDSYTAVKHFAVYRHLPVRNDQGEVERDTLLLGIRSHDLLTVLNSQDGFAHQSTVLMDASGDYIVSSSEFKSTNFFQYLYVYNDLTLDARNAIAQKVAQSDSGELYYRDGIGRDCVFRYERMTTNNWYCVTSVPIASFRTPVSSSNYARYAVFVLLLMLAMDIVWLQSMNRRLRFSMQREKEASEAKTAFLSRMSHDIRTPLNGIIGLTTLAMDEQNPARTQEYLENVKVSGQFLTGLVNDILELSRVESGRVELHPEPYTCFDLCKYVEAVILPLCVEKGLTFRLSPTDNELPVLLDRLRFNQIMFNLLSNAVKYTPAGGVVELFWTRSNLENGRVKLSFTVRDNGIGMSEAFQEHMFDSFTQERTQAASTGSGLGLAIVRSLTGLMNGSIDVESKQGVGTTVTIHLETDVCREKTPVHPHSEPSSLAGKRALLCEDNQINTLVVVRLLEKWGMGVVTASNGREGVELFVASQPGAFDVILMDVMMPELNGLDATRVIRQLDRTDASMVPIIAMTANAYDTDVENCRDAGMTAHMGKLIDQERLRDLLSRVTAKYETDYCQNGDADIADGD